MRRIRGRKNEEFFRGGIDILMKITHSVSPYYNFVNNNAVSTKLPTVMLYIMIYVTAIFDVSKMKTGVSY